MARLRHAVGGLGQLGPTRRALRIPLHCPPMDPDFWQARWREGRIGFHRSDANPNLVEHLEHLGAPQGDAAVFVPLCGKSVDLPFLVGRGFPVVGAEISELACRALFEEQGLAYSERRVGAYTRFEAGALSVLCGDYFGLQPADLGPIHGAWDRAALIAMPPERRPRYVATLARLLPQGAPLLLVSVDYPPGPMQGPPFSVPDAEVRTLFGDTFRIESSHAHDALDDNPRFRDAGLGALRETVYRARRS
jgi:thiopurine S-methyltransferase